ncbi:MAG: hypothetical protein WD750_01490 [Gammaproteobacteria bacterium]
MIRVALSNQLQILANCNAEVDLDVTPPATIAAVLDALENHYPMLCGAGR